MADSAEFVLELVDKVSGPAKAAGLAIWHIHERVESLFKLWHAIQYARSGQLRRDVRNLGETLKETAIGVAAKLAVGGAAAAAYGYQLTKGVVEMGVYAESSRRSLAALTGSVSGGAAAFNQAVQVAKDLGLNVESTVDSFKHLLAMQFTVGEATELVKISADLQAITGDAQSAERAITALTQIKAKGKLQAEELVGQLAEAGVSTMLVYKELGKILGKDEAAVRKMISAGEIDADTGVLAIKRAIMQKLHESAPGQAAAGFANETLQGLMQQLQNAPGRFFLRVANAAQASLSKLAPIVKEITAAIDGLDTATIAEFVGHMLDFAAGAVKFAKEFVFAFMEGTNEINKVLGDQDAGKNALKLAAELGHLLAEAAVYALKLASWIASIAVYLNDHRWIVYTAAALWLFGKLFTIALMVTHALTVMGAALWVWRTFSLGPLLLQTARWILLLGRAALGVDLIRNALMWVGRMMFRQLILIPGLIAGVALIAFAIFYYWDEIVDYFKTGIDVMKKEFSDLWFSFVEFAKAFATGEIWSEAGQEAGSKFWDAFVTAWWNNVKRFTPGLQAGLDLMHAELQMVGLEKQDITPEDRSMFALGAKASTAPASKESEAEQLRKGNIDTLLAKLQANAEKGGGQLKIDSLHVNVESKSDDPREHGRVAAEGVEKELRSHWTVLSTEFAGG